VPISKVSTLKTIAGIIKSPVIATSNLVSALVDTALDSSDAQRQQSVLLKGYCIATRPYTSVCNLTKASIDTASRTEACQETPAESRCGSVIAIEDGDSIVKPGIASQWDDFVGFMCVNPDQVRIRTRCNAINFKKY